MKKLSQCGILLGLLVGVPTNISFGQTMSPELMVRQVLLSHIGSQGLPSDFIIQGQGTDSAGTYSLRMLVKGKNQIRYERIQGARTAVSIYSAGAAWSGPSAAMKSLMEHAAIRRPIELPFLDVIGAVGDSHWNVRYLGPAILGSTTVLHFAVHYLDPTAAEKRFLSRPLDEDADFFVDAATSLIVRSQRMQAADNSMDFKVPSILDFSDYRQVNGMMIAFRIVNTIGNRFSGITQTTIVVQSVLMNQGIADSVFRPQ